MKGLRLDKYLWFARFARTRTIAQEMIDRGDVRLDGERIFTRHADVRIGHVITLTSNARFRVIRVEQLPSRRGSPTDALSTYTEILPAQPIDARSPSH